MQQSTACLHFAWRTKSQRVGGRAARLNCLPACPASRRRLTGRRDGLVLCGGVNWVGQTSAFCVGVCPAVALRRPTHSDTDQTQNAPVWRPSRLNSHRHTRHDKTVLSVSCLVCRCELDYCSEYVHRLQIFCQRHF